MKQSKKLLSIILAMIMAFSVVSVVGNAALVEGTVGYDSIDDAILTPEQVADIALDLVDKDVLAGQKALDLSILGTYEIDSVDKAFSSIYSLLDNGTINLVAGGDLQKIMDNKDKLYNSSAKRTYTRADGDLVCVYALLNFLNVNAGYISKVVYGLGTDNGISLGGASGIITGISAVKDINETLQNIQELIREPIFDALLYGSYSYPTKYADTASVKGMTFDTMLNTALYNLLTTPQDYKRDASDNKIWETDTITTTDRVSASSVNLNNNSLLQILDNIIQVAYEDYGVAGLNNEIKRLLMEATGVDFVRVTDAATINMIKAAPGYVDTATATGEALRSVKNYAFNSQMLKIGNVWYLRTNGNEDVLDENGNKTYDGEGNVIREKTDKFWKAKTGNTNAFYDIVNWDFTFSASDFTFSDLIRDYGSIFGSLNHIVATILNKGIKSSINVSNLWEDGDNSKVNDNILTTAQWVVKNFTKDIFGKTSAYVGTDGNATAAFISAVDGCTKLVDLVAYIGLPFMNDAMPQLIMPKNANGDLNFTSGLQVLQLGALAIREFVTDIAPTVNYDSQIFAAGSLTSASGRQFASHTAEEWIDIIISMGIDIAYTYLDNITNFNMSVAEANAKGWGWHEKLEEIVDWAVLYLDSQGSTSPIIGLEPGTLATARGTYSGDASYSFNVLSKALNTLLPLGFISNCSSATYALDVEVLFNHIKDIATNLNFETILSFFGRNGRSDNILSNTNVVSAVLSVVQKLLGALLGSNTFAVGSNLEATLANANLKTIVNNLLVNLYSRRIALLENVLPIVAKFVDGWGTEQEMGTPTLSLASVVSADDSNNISSSFTVANGSKGVWRRYIDAQGTEHKDKQYKYVITSAYATNLDGSAASEVTFPSYTTTAIDFGATGTVNFAMNGVPEAGKSVYMNVQYYVTDEDGQPMADGARFIASKLVYLSRATDHGVQKLVITDSKLYVRLDSNYYFTSVADAQAKLAAGMEAYYIRKSNIAQTRTVDISVASVPAGITLEGYSKKTSVEITQNTNYGYNEAAFNSANYQPGDVLEIKINASTTNTSQQQFTNRIWLIDTTGQNDLYKLVNDFASSQKKAENYNTGDCLAKAVLTSADSTDSEGNAVVRESNFSATALNAAGETVTAINGAQAWSNYIAALNTATHAAYQVWNPASIYDFVTYYNNLKVAASDLEYCKKTATELAAAGGADLSTDVATLKTVLNGIEDNTIAGKGYTDYMLYRWNRYTEWRDKANNLVSLAKAASYATPDDMYFSYANISETDLRALVSGNNYESYILALLKSYSTEDMAQRDKDLTNTKNNFSGYTALDVAQIENMLTRTSQRLLSRGAVDNTYITSEITSAQNAIGTSRGNYTIRSWARYSTALTNAIAAAAGDSQVKMFDAKYELQVARNELKVEAAEANYDELEALIAQAEGVLANVSLYNNTAADFGKVLAALGMSAIQNADGDDVYLFSNTAKDANNKSYAAEDQNKVDRASDALKVALAAMKFKTTSGGASGVAPVAPATPEVALDNNVVLEEDEQGTPTVTASVATIDANKNASAVKALFTAIAQGASTVEMEISNDNNYANNTDEDLVLTGTNATLTVFTTVSGVKVPVATIKIVVKADLNGDGVIDVLDGLTGELAVNGQATLAGCFFLAGDVDSNDVLDTNDFGLIVNKAVA